MRFSKYIIILPLLWWGFDVRAQVAEEVSSVPEQWQLTLDVIKSKAQTLLIENNGLQDENRQLMAQEQKLQKSIDDQQSKNEHKSRLLKERHGRTDQQVRIEELTQGIKTKKQEALILNKQLEEWNKKKTDQDHKIQKLKNMISDIGLQQQTEKQKVQVSQNIEKPKGDDQLAQWRKRLEDENRQEALLENQLEAIKRGGESQHLNIDVIKDQNKQLEARLNFLQMERLRHLKKSSAEIQAQANARKYDQLKKHKDQLEADINAYESRLNELRESSLTELSWPVKRKKLIKEMVQADARNNKLRDKIKELKEDIDVLRDQVARLERRVDFAQGKGTRQ